MLAVGLPLAIGLGTALAAVVLDDWHTPLVDETPRLHQIPPADALYLTIDPLRDTEAFGADPGRVDDVTVWIAEVEHQQRKVVAFDSLQPSMRLAWFKASLKTTSPGPTSAWMVPTLAA